MKKIIVTILAVLGVAMAVFGFLFLTRERLDYAGAIGNVKEMMSVEETILAEWDDETLDVEEDEVAEENFVGLSEAVAKFQQYYVGLGASNALKDKEVKRYYDEIAILANKLEEMKRIATKMASYLSAVRSGSGVAESRQDLVNDDNEWAKTLGVDLENYAQAVEEFEMAYADRKADDYNVMLEEYGSLMTEGEELTKKYEVVTWDEILGIERVELEGYFATVEQLLELLEAK